MKKKRILVADDVEGVRFAIAQALRDCDMDIDFAEIPDSVERKIEKPLYKVIPYNSKFSYGKDFSDFENVKIFRSNIKFRNNLLLYFIYIHRSGIFTKDNKGFRTIRTFPEHGGVRHATCQSPRLYCRRPGKHAGFR